MPRDRTALRAVLGQEGAFVRTWVRARVSADARPRTATDPRWLGDDIADALAALPASPVRRGTVALWPEELAVLGARDVPPGVLVSVEGPREGRLRRGSGAWPFVIDADLGEPGGWWHGALGLWSYVSLIRAAVERRAAGEGDVEVLYEDLDYDHPDGLTLRVRVRRLEQRADAAFEAAQVVLADLRGPAARAERGAQREIRDALAALSA